MARFFGIRPDGHFEILHTFGANNPTTGANKDGAYPDLGMIFDEQDDSLIVIAVIGGHGSSAGLDYSGARCMS